MYLRSKDWILVNNIIKVFVPIVILCVCNSWIVLALTKSKKKTDALFNMKKLPKRVSTHTLKSINKRKSLTTANEEVTLTNSNESNIGRLTPNETGTFLFENKH